MDAGILRKLGLSQNEAAVYIKLLEMGPSLTSRIAKLTRFNRTYSYDLLKSLIDKGLVSYALRENRKYFQATQPENLLELLKEKERDLEKQKLQLSSYISELKKIKTLSEPSLMAVIYQGKEGFRTILNEVLSVGEDYLVMGYSIKIEELMQHVIPNFQKQRVARKIRRKIILNSDTRGKWSSKAPLQDVRYFPKGHDPLIGMIIYGTKVVILSTQEKDIVGLCIEDKATHDSFRSYFDMLWKTSDDA